MEKENPNTFVPRCFYFLVLISILIFGSLSAQQEFSVSPLGHLGGYAGCSAVVGDHAFLVQGTMLSVLSLSGEDLQKIASFPLPNEPSDCIASGNYLYFIELNFGDNSNAMMRIVDISDAENPFFKDSLVVKEDIGWFEPRMFVAGDYLYLTLGEEFQIIDVTDPDSPQILSINPITANDIFVQGDYAFIGGNENFVVYNVSDKQNPTEVGSCDVDRVVTVFIQGHFAYVGLDNFPNIGLQIIDITNPAEPSKLSFLETTIVEGQTTHYKSPRRVAVSGDYAYIGTRAVGANLFVINIADSLLPVETGRLDFEQLGFPDFQSLQLEYPYLYFASGASSNQFFGVNVTDPANPAIEQLYQEPWDVQSIVSDGDTLFVSSWDRIWAYDFSDTTRPALVGSDTAWAEFSRMEIQNGYLYGVREHELHILDVNDPGNIFEVGRFISETESIMEMSVCGHFVYLLRVSEERSFLEVINILDPGNPVKEAAEYNLPGDGRALCLLPDSLFAFVAYYASDTDQGFQIVDVADSSEFLLLGSAQSLGNPIAIDVKDTLTIVASNSADSWFLEAYNFKDTANPENLGGPSGNDIIADVVMKDDGLVVASIPNGSLHYYDISSAASILTWTILKICHSPYSTFISSIIHRSFSIFFSIDGFFCTENKTVSGSWGIFFQKLAIASILSEIRVTPQNVSLTFGDTLDFEAKGYDDQGNEVSIDIKWSATGGTVDSTTGKYTATEEGDFTITALDTNQSVSGSANVHVTATGVREKSIVSNEFGLTQNYPNPFNPTTTIKFSVKDECWVRLKIFDIRSREVAAPVNGLFQPGVYQAHFDGSQLASGIYFCRIQMKNFCATRKMLLLE